MLKFPGIKEDVSMHVQTKNLVSGLLRMQVISGVSTVPMSQLYSVYPNARVTTDYNSQTHATLVKVLQRLN